MATTGWTCDIDGCRPEVENIPLSSASTDVQSTALNSSLISSTEPSFKRARLLDTIPPNGSTNGYIGLPKKPMSDGFPYRPEVMIEFKTKFEATVQNMLKSKLSAYFSRLACVEKEVDSLKNELNQLGKRMDYIDISSKELTKLISERTQLPAPSAGVGQRRTLSSQAPRQRPQNPLITNSSNKVVSHVATPCRLPVSSQPPASSPVTFAARLPVARAPPLTSNSLPPNRTSLTSLVSQAIITPPTNPIKNSMMNSLSVRPPETIDLTAEASPGEQPSGPPTSNTKTNTTPIANGFSDNNVYYASPFNQSALSPECPRPRPMQFTAPSNLNFEPRLASSTVARGPSRVARPSAIQLPRPISYRDVQSLPIAPLPPVPIPPVHNVPIQPVPQLTIAEAAEGICLQWTISHCTVAFESATAYEIYSYASSELTPETIRTCLPWKKVGEVAALPLPMACTLTHVQSNNLYYFVVRSIDRFRRYSPWSNVVNAYVG
ncbi:unnamed protein product [Calicophoron daubneyi]|uniref:Activating transcription factor 7-interacting protein Fn3 domain-containing protein n=1 Tax=Calicophoron daubneyi TaxID=300641 RepID=A0AAV2TTQ1_CALDB